MLKSNRRDRPERPTRMVFINRYFYPDHSATSQMLSDLAFALAARHHHISVITSRQRYDDPNAGLPAHETIRGVEIHRVATTSFGRGALLGRAVDYVTFYGAAALKLWELTRAGDVVVAKTDPPMLSVVAGPIARARGAALVNWLQDIFPEVASRSGMGQGPLLQLGYGALKMLRTWSLRLATMNVVLGDRMASQVKALGVNPDRISIIPNWADGTLIKPVAHDDNNLRKHWNLRGRFVVGYSGNLGRVHDYQTFLDAIELIGSASAPGRSIVVSSAGAIPRTSEGENPRPEIVWLFIGGGAGLRQFRAEVQKRQITTVQFHDYQPREGLAESLSAADVHLVSLNPQLEGLVVPSKYYGIAAAGRPCIFVGDKAGEIAEVLARGRAGFTVAPGDGAALASLVCQLAADPEQVRDMGQNARALFSSHYDMGLSVQRWVDLLAAVSGHPAKSSAAIDVTSVGKTSC